MKIVARWWLDGKPRVWESENDCILNVEPSDQSTSLILAPAFHDIQVNGGGGVGFTNDGLKVADVLRVVQLHQSHGTASFFPTVITASRATMLHSLRTIREAIEADPQVAAGCPGIHLEGPMISPDDGYRGAHPKEHVRPLSFAEFIEFQEASGWRIRLVTLAPEVQGALELIPQLLGQGVRVSLGHTRASANEIRAAVDAGASISTHLGNGLAKQLDRHANPIWPQLADDRLFTSIIADGQHLTAEIVQVTAKVKQDRLVLISDASSFAGCPPGVYQDWGSSIEVTEDNRVTLAGTPYLAGSGAFLRDCVAWAVKHGLRFQVAIRAATTTPRELFDLPPTTTWLLWDEARRMTNILDATRVVESVP